MGLVLASQDLGHGFENLVSPSFIVVIKQSQLFDSDDDVRFPLKYSG
jgi:hypothetical protein